MPMENMQLLEFVDRFPVKEYRISDEKIEARILGGGPEQESDWKVVSSEQLSSHVKKQYLSGSLVGTEFGLEAASPSMCWLGADEIHTGLDDSIE